MQASNILTMVFLSSAILCAASTNPCSVYIRAQLQCFSDGNLYIDQCYANLAKPGLKLIFDCGFPIDEEKCKATCQELIKPCPQYFVPQGSCFSNGEVYTDDCYAHKVDPTLKEIFKCPTPFNQEECTKQCKVQNQPCPLYFMAQGYCYNNGKVYTDDCYAHKEDSSLVSLFKCSLPFKGVKCEKQCQCFTKCPISKTDLPVCGVSGTLYPNLCRIQCVKEPIKFRCTLVDYSLGICARRCSSQASATA